MLQALFKPSPAKLAGRKLYAEVSAAARRPALYTQGHVPDTPEGRFEVYLMHLVLVLRRLKGRGDGARAVSQALFDAFVRGLDDGLREMGVGDLSVGKKMRKLGEAIYGRLNSYDTAFPADDPPGAIAALLGRTIPGQPGEGAAWLARYVVAADVALASQPDEAVAAGVVAFPEPVALDAAA